MRKISSILLLVGWVLLMAGFTAAAEPLGDNISGTPAMASAKAKMNTMTIYVPTQDGDGVLAAPDCGTDLTCKSKPIVITYTDEIPGTGAADVFAAISRDDGDTWNITNLSNSAGLSSFTLADGTVYPGDCRKPVMVVKGNKIFVAWSSKYAPRIEADYSADIYGVMGEQRSIDYTYAYKGEFAWAGEIPYSAVWTARGTIATADNPETGVEAGDIVWQPAQQLTSGIRDALQIFAGGAGKVGFALSWQEDPEGLLPGSGDGPGHGWSGAIANHKTDIWYSYIPWSQFDSPASYLQAPVRISDNDMCRPGKQSDISLISDDRNRYGWLFKHSDQLTDYCEDLVFDRVSYDVGSSDDPEYAATHQYCEDICYETATILNDQGEMKEVCVTEDGRMLDGRRAATRPNIFLQPYTDANGKLQAWVILGYEETKGFIEPGVFDEGKVIIYHSFDMRAPNLVSGGTTVNLNEVVKNDDGTETVTDLYENARRIRFIIQPPGKMGTARVPLVAIYKQGRYGTGQPSDIFLRRFVVPESDDPAVDNPYRPENLQAGAFNMSSFTPSGDYYVDQEHPEDGVKVPEGIIQTEANLYDQSYDNMFSEARAHRGQIRGDKITLGYAQTLNWVASNNGRDKYDFYVRRSFDGGATWTDAAGNFEAAKNVSNLPDNTCSVIEPRLVSTPGSITCLIGVDPVTGEDKYAPCTAEDRQAVETYMVTYGTEVNTEDGGPADLFYARTTDFGETYELVSDGYSEPAFDILAGGDSEQGEVQIRMTPDGSKFYSSWLGEMELANDPPTAEEGSDIRFRRIDY